MKRMFTIMLAGFMMIEPSGSVISSERHPAMAHDSIQPMLGAVMHSEIEEVRRLAEQHRGLDERSPSDGGTPIIYAAGTDQWPVVEILIDHGADIWAHNEFGMTAPELAVSSRILPGSAEDKARLRVIEKLKSRGYPFPPPSSQEVLDLDKAGKWPPAGAKR